MTLNPKISKISLPLKLGYVYAAVAPKSEKEVSSLKYYKYNLILSLKAFTITVFDHRPVFLSVYGYSVHILDFEVDIIDLNLFNTNTVFCT